MVILLDAMRCATSTLLAILLLSSPSRAQTSVDTPAGKLTAGGYVEAFYQWNFNDPSNGITNFRGFDNRHDSFTLANAALDGQWEKGPVSGRVTLQIGHTPNTYYLAEPFSAGTSGAGVSDAPTWKYLQQAYIGAKAPVGKGLLIQAGLFLSPVGVESIAVKDDWTWSRSNLFFGLPFYHTGVRLTQTVTDRLNVVLAAYNGWNSVVDNNKGKSISGQLAYTDGDDLLFSILYFGGPERATGSPEGEPWRHLFDAWISARVADPLWATLCADAGFEKNAFGTSSWGAGAAYVRGRVFDWLYLATRADYFFEHEPDGASRIFWPVDWVASATETIDVHPADNLIVRLEGRSDLAAGPMFFRDKVEGDGSAEHPFMPNTKRQATLTLGATAWF